jgi:hypothetical protein
MKHESRTIGQSRTWAHELLGRLERDWEPPADALAHYQHWFKAVRKARSWKAWAVRSKYWCSLATLMERRDKALAKVIRGQRH